MTGYGRAAFSVGSLDFTVEIASVNQRGLAISVSAPTDWGHDAERLLVPLIRERAARGKITVALRLAAAQHAGAPVFAWDDSAVAKALQKMAASAAAAGVQFEATSEVYLRLAELNRTTQNAFPSLQDAEVAESVLAGAREALARFVAMREEEGLALEKDFRARLGRLRAWAEKIREASSGTVENYRENLRARLAALELEIDLDDPRFLKEIALFADRCDIAEELTRLNSHFAQFENCLQESESGRKLDFICQEILREFNTIGSKANNATVTRYVVEAKNEQERLREQVQNVE